MTHKLAQHRITCLVVALFVLAALGVSVGVAQAGTSSQTNSAQTNSAQKNAAQKSTAATGNRLVSTVAAGTVITPAESCAALGQADFSTVLGASTTIPPREGRARP